MMTLQLTLRPLSTAVAEVFITVFVQTKFTYVCFVHAIFIVTKMKMGVEVRLRVRSSVCLQRESASITLTMQTSFSLTIDGKIQL